MVSGAVRKDCRSDSHRYVLFFNILASVPGQAFSVFLPIIVQGLGYSSIKANLVSGPAVFSDLAVIWKPLTLWAVRLTCRHSVR